MTHFSEELRKILEELTFNKLEDWKKISINESINRAISDITELVKKIVPEEERPYFLSLLRIDAEIGQAFYYRSGRVEGHNSCRTKMLKEVE